MNDKEALAMMNRCKEEIEGMRRRIDFLAPQAEAYNAIRQILGLTSRDGAGEAMGQDVLWTLREQIGKIEARIKAEKTERNEKLDQLKNEIYVDADGNEVRDPMEPMELRQGVSSTKQSHRLGAQGEFP